MNNLNTVWQEHNAHYWLVFVAVAAIAFNLFVSWTNEFAGDMQALTSDGALAAVSSTDDSVRVLIDFGSRKRAFEGSAEQNMTVASALDEIASVAKFSVRVEDGQIVSVDGQANSDTAQWSVYLNDILVQTAIDEEALKAGDKVSIVFE